MKDEKKVFDMTCLDEALKKSYLEAFKNQRGDTSLPGPPASSHCCIVGSCFIGNMTAEQRDRLTQLRALLGDASGLKMFKAEYPSAEYSEWDPEEERKKSRQWREDFERRQWEHVPAATRDFVKQCWKDDVLVCDRCVWLDENPEKRRPHEPGHVYGTCVRENRKMADGDIYPCNLQHVADKRVKANQERRKRHDELLAKNMEPVEPRFRYHPSMKPEDMKRAGLEMLLSILPKCWKNDYAPSSYEELRFPNGALLDRMYTYSFRTKFLYLDADIDRFDGTHTITIDEDIHPENDEGDVVEIASAEASNFHDAWRMITEQLNISASDRLTAAGKD